MSESKTHIEKLQGFLDYNKAFEKKARELLFAPKRDNVVIKIWFIRESENFIKINQEFSSYLQKEGREDILDLEAMMLQHKIKEVLREEQHLIDLITLLPIQEEKMQK